jgi:hypothetical protein
MTTFSEFNDIMNLQAAKVLQYLKRGVCHTCVALAIYIKRYLLKAKEEL